MESCLPKGPRAAAPHLVELQHPELDFLVLVLLLLGLGVGLLLPLLSTTEQAAQDVQGGLILDARQGQQVTVLQLLAVEQDALLVARQACACGYAREQGLPWRLSLLFRPPLHQACPGLKLRACLSC